MSYHTTLSDRSLKQVLRKLLSPRALVLGAIGAPIMALAGPTGGQVAAGAANITAPVPNGTVIDQTSQSAVINWQSFNIGSQEYVQFNQPDSSSVVLNRVVGGDASSILGSLSANGQVFLVNPQGVFFGAGATLDVGGLVATTMDISDSDFMSGHYVFTKADGSVSASVLNAGSIKAHPGGYVVLAGDYTENSGVISAQAGQVVLAAGSQMTLDIGSGGLISYAVDQATLSSLAGVKNAGQIIADGGTVLMTAKVANALTATAVNNSGVITAHSVQEHDGVIILAAQGGGIEDSGTLDASASESGVSGGYIRIRGDGHTEITSTANIDAAGSGARGGFIELSGHTLSLRGQTKLGHSGTLLIDPAKLSIATGSTAPSSTGATTYQVGVGYIQNQLNSNNNVVLVASNSIGHASGVTSLTATGTGKLTLKTGTLSVVSTGASLGPAGFQCWADGVCASPASGAAGATFTPTSGLISLNGMTVNIAGAFEVNAANGTVNVGNVTARSVTVVADQITVGNLVTNGSAGINLTASDGAASVHIAAGSLTANGAGGIVLKTQGSANGSIVVGGAVNAGGAFTASAAVPSFGGNISLFGAATAKQITITAQALNGGNIVAGNLTAPQIAVQSKTGNLTLGNLKASDSTAPVSIDVGTGPSGTAGGTVSIGSITATGKEGSHGTSGASVNIYARANSGANVTVGGITLSAAKAHYTRSSSYTSGTATVHRTSSGSSGRANLAIHGGGSGASVTVNGAISVTGHGIVGAAIDGAPNINVTGAIGVTDSGGGSRTFTWVANSAGKTQTMHRVAPKWGAANVNISGVVGSSAGSVSLGNVTVNGAFGTIFIQGGTIATGALTATAYGRSSDVRSGSLVVGSVTKTLSSSDNNFGSANVTVQAFGGSNANISVGGAIAATANGGQANVSLHGAHVVTKGITVSASASHVNLAGDVIPSSASYVFNYRNFKYTPDTLTLGANLTHGTASMGIAHIDIAGAMPLGTGTGTGSSAPALSYSASGNLSATGVGDASVKIDAANVNITGGIAAVATAAHMNMSGATSGGVTTHISGSLGAAGVRITGGSASSDSVTVTGPISVTGPMAQVQVTGKHMSLGSVSASGTGLNRTVTQTNSASSNIYSSHTTQGPARVELTGGGGSFDSLSSVNVGNVTVTAAGGASAQLHAGNVVAGNVAASFTPGSRTVTGFPTGLNSIATFSGSGARMQIGAYSSASVGNLSAPNIDIHTKHGALVAGNLTASSANAPVMISVQGGTSGSGASVSINGNVTASGRGSAGSANPFNGAGAAATVHIDSGYGSHSVNITGGINVSGAAAPVSAHSSDSYTYALVGSLGRADLTIGQSSTTGATINVGGGITVAGAGGAHAELIATSVNVAGTLKVSAAPTTLTQSSTYHYGSGSLASSGAMRLTQTAGIADLTISAPEGPSGAVQLGAVTVGGTVGSVSIRGHSVTTGNITVNTAPGTFDLTSSGHSPGGSFALTSHASAGIARVEVIAGTSTSSGTANLGAVNIAGNGLAAIHVGAGTINVGAITVSGGAGTFTRTQSGSPHYYGSMFKGPMALWQSVGLNQGSAVIGVASVALDGRFNSYGSYGRPPAAVSVSVGGAVAVTGKGRARVDLAGDTVTVASTVSVSATKGKLQGSAHFLQGTSGGVSYQVSRTVSDSVGSADISLGHSGGTSVAVGGAMSATGTAAAVEVQGTNIGVMGISATGTGGGHVSESATYAPTGSQGTAFSTTFKGPGDITGVRLIGAPSGSLSVQGDIVIQGKGFVGAIIADGAVNTRNISLTASGSATYQVTDTRNATPTQTFTVGDVGLAIGQMAGGSAVSPATIAGSVTLTAVRDVDLGIAGNVSGAVKVAAGRDIAGAKPGFLTVIDKARSGPGSSGSSIVFPTPALTASAAEFTAGRNINLSGATVTIGSGSIAGMTGDSKAAALAGLASGAAPNALFDAGASLKMPNFTLNGSYAWLKAGQFTSAGSATIASGALVQISPHASASSIGINASGTGSQATMLGVTPFLGAFTGGGTVAIGGASQTGGIVLAGNANLGSANVILLTSGVVSGSGKLVSGGLTLVTSGASTSLVVQTPTVNFQGSGALSVDDTAYTGTASFNLGTGTLTTVTGNFGGNVNLISPVNASAFTLTAAGAANLGGQTINVTNAAAFKVGTSFAAGGATINAGSLTLDGGSATDFTVTANTATLQVGGGRNIAITDTFASPATLGLGAGTYGSVAVTFAGAGTVNGTFTAQSLQAGAGGALNLGGGIITAGPVANLTATGGISNTGKLVAGAVNASAGGIINLITQTGSINIASATDVTVDDTAQTGVASVAFGSGSFGAVALNFGGDGTLTSGLKGSALGMVAGGNLDISGQSINVSGGLTMTATKNIAMSGVSITAGTVSMTAGGSIHNGSSAGTVKANGLAMVAVGDILVPNTTFTIGSGSVAGIFGDAQLVQALAGQGLAPASVNPNATFISGGNLDIGGLNFSGSYLYLQAQSLTLPSSVTAPSGVLVQFSPYVTTDTIGLEDAPATTATINYSNQADLSLFPGGTLVIGSSVESGDVSIGTQGPFDIGASNLVIATSGNITGLDTVTSTGLITDLETLINGIFEVPTTTEIDPSSGSTLETGNLTGDSSGSSTDDNSDDNKKKNGGSGDSGDSGSNSNTLIKHEQSEPSGICT